MSNHKQQDRVVSDTSKAPFHGVQRHCVGYFPINFLERREEYEVTLNLLEISPKLSDNTSILNRPTHVFRSSPEILEQLRQKAIEDSDLTHVEVVEAHSELGFPCYLYAKHKSGEEIFYDGIIFRITVNITDKEFHLKDATSLMGYPPHPESIDSLNYAIKKVKSDFPLSVYKFRLFYTALKTDWGLLKVKAYGDPSIQLPLIDPNFVRITNLKYAEYGGKFYLYIGDYKKTLQLIAHDFYQCNEIEHWKKYILLKTENARDCFQQASSGFATLSMSLKHLKLKLSAWSKAKRGFIYLLQESPLLYRYELLFEAYEKIAEANLSSINGMRQIFISNDDWDNRSAVAHWEKYFFKGEIKDNQILNISEEPISPEYTHSINSLRSDIAVLKNAIRESFDLSKDFFASAQTEFSAYSIWLAILAIVISSVLGAIPLFTSSETKLLDQPENQPKLNIGSFPKPPSSVVFLSFDETLISFETGRNAVRIFTRNNQILMNLYNKQSKVTQLNGIPVDVEQVSGGIRYRNLQLKVAVEVFSAPVLLVNDKVVR